MTVHDDRAGSSPNILKLQTRRTAAVPNKEGTKALYTIVNVSDNRASVIETRVLDLESNTSSLFSNDPRVKEATWLGVANLVVWLKEVDLGTTEIWVADVDNDGQTYKESGTSASVGSPERKGHPCGSKFVGMIEGKASQLKVHDLSHDSNSIAITLICHNSEASGSASAGVSSKSIWYTTLQRRDPANDTKYGVKYFIFPKCFINAITNSGSESSLLHPNIQSLSDFDISASGIVFLAKDSTVPHESTNVYFVPLQNFQEPSKLGPQMINVKGFHGNSSCPVLSPDGNSLAFLKVQDPTELNDRNRVIVINNVREIQAPVDITNMPTSQSEKSWHLSPLSIAWSEDGKELYVVAIEAGLRKLFKLPASVSSIKKTPECITSDSRTPADLRYLRMVFSAPIDVTSPA